MKTIGFLKRHDNYSFSKNDLTYFTTNSVSYDKELVVKYLKSGVLCLPISEIITEGEEDNEEILGTSSIFTDGVWFWPEYFLSYLERDFQINIDLEFINHINNNKRLINSIEQNDLINLENLFATKIGFV